MTIHTDTQTSNDTDTPQVLGTIEYLDPNQLGFEANVRDQVDLDKEFLDSLREHGVIVPITAIRTDDGHTVVREGQCRTLGARAVGLASVPVFVLNAAAADVDAQTVERIVHQIVANDQRKALRNDQRARAIQQMLDTGLSATKIAKQISLSRDDVKAAGAAAKSPTALDALASGQMDFIEAAALVEFEEDEQAVRRLLQVAGSPSFDHTVAQLRTEREIAELEAEAAATYTEQGYTVLEQRPRWDDMSCLSIRYLRTPEGDAATSEAVTDPAQWSAYLTEDWAYLDAETSEPVDPDMVDDDTREDPNLEPEEGLRHYRTVVEKTVFVPEWYCRDYRAAGLQLCPSLQNRGASVDTSTDGGEDDAEAAAQRLAEQEQAQRRERRKVLVLNRLGEAAAAVRREYVTRLLARKAAPKGAATFVAYCLTHDRFILSQNHGSETTAELLGAKDDRAVRAMVSDPSTHTDARAQVIALAVVLGAMEARTTKDAWRSARSGITGNATYFPHTLGSDVYLRFIIETGYTPSPVEQVIVGDKTSDAVFDEELADQ